MAWRKEVIRADPTRVLGTRVASSAHAIRFGPLLFVTGQSGRQLSGPEWDPDPATQARQCLENIGEILRAGGSSFDLVLKRTIYVRDRDEYDAMRPVVEEFFSAPVASTIIVSGLLRDERKAIEIEVIAGVLDDADAGDVA